MRVERWTAQWQAFEHETAVSRSGGARTATPGQRRSQELDAKEGVAGAVGRAAATAAIPSRFGKAVGAGLGAAVNSGHTVRVSWADGKQSIIEFPEKQFMVFSVLLKDRQIAIELSEKPEADVPSAQPGVSERIADLAFSVLSKSKQASPTAEYVPAQDVTERIAKLAALHAQGILTDAEFSNKKAELLKRDSSSASSL